MTCRSNWSVNSRGVRRACAIALAAFFFLIASWGLAAPQDGLPPAPADLDRSTPRQAMNALLETLRVGQFDRAAYLIDLRDVPRQKQAAEGPNVARMLWYVLSRQARIDVGAISDEPTGNEADGRTTEKVGSIPLLGNEVPLRLSRIVVQGREPIWLLSRETVRALPELYEEYGPGWFATQLPEWAHRTVFLGLPAWQWLGLGALGIVSVLLGLAVSSLVISVGGRIASQTEARWDDLIVTGARHPVRLFFVVAIFATSSTSLRLPIVAEALRSRILGCLLIASAAWLVMRITRAIGDAIALDLTEHQDDALIRQGTVAQVAVGRRVINVVVATIATALALLQFQVVRQVGLSVLASAGIVGIVFGLAAQRVLGNVLAGIQISVARPMRIGDRVLIENQFGFVEEIGLTFVVIKTWDKRRLILPITQFVEKPFENWTRTDRQLIATMNFYADYSVPVARLREEFRHLVENDPDWDGDTLDFSVVDTTERTVVLRGIASADAARLFDMHCRVREKMVEFLQRLDGGVYLPRTRIETGFGAASTEAALSVRAPVSQRRAES